MKAAMIAVLLEALEMITRSPPQSLLSATKSSISHEV
jgi:hypothetical protein